MILFHELSANNPKVLREWPKIRPDSGNKFVVKQGLV